MFFLNYNAPYLIKELEAAEERLAKSRVEARVCQGLIYELTSSLAQQRLETLGIKEGDIIVIDFAGTGEEEVKFECLSTDWRHIPCLKIKYKLKSGKWRTHTSEFEAEYYEQIIRKVDR